eukprot:TRINITY_DN90483_c0_g1_i1.p1 TRINITY_DN90483_c0_g1~~TRINITY_DN90483_c0_g1_i1.p1  ORF type:complete len:234 (-),score=45.22 TRINITY_DN90483_c0_g1_i1:89-790(-)
MLASSCCVCDHVDRGEESFAAQLSRSGKVSYEPVAEPSPSAPSEETLHAAAVSSSSKANADTSQQKFRLQEFVKDFAKCAVRGVKCHVLDGHTGEVITVSYGIDPDLRRLTLRRLPVKSELDTPYAELELSHIKDVHDFDAAFALGKVTSAEHLPEVVSSKVDTVDLKERFIMILPEAAGSSMDGPLFIMEASSVDRDRFIMCMKILRLYAQSSHGFDSGADRTSILGSFALS